MKIKVDKKSFFAYVRSKTKSKAQVGPLCKIKSILLKFADNTKMFAKVNSDADRKQLQDDMNKLCEREKRWNMEFNVDKCVTMHINRDQLNSRFHGRDIFREIGLLP